MKNNRKKYNNDLLTLGINLLLFANYLLTFGDNSTLKKLDGWAKFRNVATNLKRFFYQYILAYYRHICFVSLIQSTSIIYIYIYIYKYMYKWLNK